MRLLPQSRFDIYALSLPHGLGFGKQLPVEAWESDDSIACGVLTQNVDDGRFGVLVMRRREDDVWAVTLQRAALASRAAAFELLAPAMRSGASREPVPVGAQRRAPLWDTSKVAPSNIYKLLAQPTHHVAAWLLNQVYLAMPKPDANWVSDCQTQNFHTRLWEALLVACFREQGLQVSQDVPSPDFYVKNRAGDDAWIEAVTANPTIPYDHYNALQTPSPLDVEDKLLGPSAVRFAKTIRSKNQRRYHLLPHVAGKPFALALADFHAPGSMVWSRPSLPSYLYGLAIDVAEAHGVRSAVQGTVGELRGDVPIPAGLFRSAEHDEISAIIFSNACSIGKFNRVGISAGALAPDLRYVRFGAFFDRSPNALVPKLFCLDVASEDYRKLWPQGYEPWSAELEIFHNPFARHPWPPSLLHEATHWHWVDGEVQCSAYYETSILHSRTLIMDASASMPTIAQLFQHDAI